MAPRSRSSGSACRRFPMVPSASARSAGRSRPDTGTSTRRRPTATRGASGERFETAASSREDVFITTKFYPARRDPVAEIEGSLRRLGVDQVDLYIIHWPQRGPRGRGREWRRRTSVDSRARSECRTSAPRSSSRSPRSRARRRRSIRFSSARSSTGGRCSKHAGPAALPSRPIARSGPAATSPIRRSQALPIAWTDGSAGAAALVHSARDDRPAEVDPPGAHRGERPDLRLLVVRRRHGHARRARHYQRRRQGSRAQVVVTLALKEELCTNRK